ncbi:hypothetical protein [Pollutibacter soli]|uniref:hypothetical protein n=1 Tax=Pollutibacter soli TaxID=3034157 RepID=UPI00301344B0
MRYLLITASLLFGFASVKSQSGVPVIKRTDTLIHRSDVIRNNLSGQRILIHREDGIVYQMEQDGMPCFAPKKSRAASIPNVFAPKSPFNSDHPMPSVPPKKGLPKYVPKKPKTF